MVLYHHAHMSDLARRVDGLVAEHEDRLVALRRELHAHPEVSWQERATTARLRAVFEDAGLRVRTFDGPGLCVDLGPQPDAADGTPQVIALRADIDALPLTETSRLPFASRTDSACHACGHDIHATALVGATLALAEIDAAEGLPAPVRCLFQPAEEVQPGGAQALMAEHVLDGVRGIFALHTEPKVDVGMVGSRIGPITAATDALTVTVGSAGGHTSRPHLTGDVVFALAQVITQVPAVLGRRLDPRAGVNLTWGAVHAGTAPNAIPAAGTVAGTIRCLDGRVWDEAGELAAATVREVLAPYGVTVDVQRRRGLPPVVNEERATRFLDTAAKDLLGDEAVVLTEQSLGGEDFAWYLTEVPGALLRLGTRTPGGPTYDLHRGDIVFDERAIGVGARILALAALRAGRDPAGAFLD